LKALLIEWDPSTGIRARNINPKDPKLRCYGWQNMDVSPAIELRLVEDDRDLSIYNNVTGVTVLQLSTEINAAIDANFPSKMVIDDEIIYAAHIKKMADNINFDSIPDDKTQRLKHLKKKYNIKGVKEIKPQKV